MLKQRKAQTAIEYLIAYVFAVILVLVAGILFYRGDFFSIHFIGKASSGFDEFSVGNDFKITSDGTATIAIVNRDRLSRQVILNSVVIDSQDTCAGDTGVLGAGVSRTITCAGVTPGEIGTSYTAVNVRINYNVGGIDYSDIGKISGKYE